MSAPQQTESLHPIVHVLACVIGRNVLGFPVGVISNNWEVPKIPRMLIVILLLGSVILL